MLRLYGYLLGVILSGISVIWRISGEPPDHWFSWLIFSINLVALPYWLAEVIKSAKLLKVDSMEKEK